MSRARRREQEVFQGGGFGGPRVAERTGVPDDGGDLTARDGGPYDRAPYDRAPVQSGRQPVRGLRVGGPGDRPVLLDQPPRVAREPYAAVPQEQYVVAGVRRLRQGVRGQDDGEAAPGGLRPDQVHDLVARRRVESGQRLVQQQ
ncbi:hypothetical protein GCM10020221_06140 [Streptomyces thioluteus]|uniref:Uncharacterized protein n=1 Tax=Streptomyces thioluteus TaxID=66431 RepID=A0ABN3WFX1_STRTU